MSPAVPSSPLSPLPSDGPDQPRFAKSSTFLARLKKQIETIQVLHIAAGTTRKAHQDMQRGLLALKVLQHESLGPYQKVTQAEAAALLKAYEDEFGALSSGEVTPDPAMGKRCRSAKEKSRTQATGEASGAPSSTVRGKRKRVNNSIDEQEDQLSLHASGPKKLKIVVEKALLPVLSNGHVMRTLRRLPSKPPVKKQETRVGAQSSSEQPTIAPPRLLATPESPSTASPIVSPKTPPRAGPSSFSPASPRLTSPSESPKPGEHMFVLPICSVSPAHPSPKSLNGQPFSLNPPHLSVELQPARQPSPELRMIKDEDMEELLTNTRRWGIYQLMRRSHHSMLKQQASMVQRRVLGLPKQRPKPPCCHCNDLDGFLVLDATDNDGDGEFRPEDEQDKEEALVKGDVGPNGQVDAPTGIEVEGKIGEDIDSDGGIQSAGKGKKVKKPKRKWMRAGGSIIKDDNISWTEGWDSWSKKAIDPAALTAKLDFDFQCFYACLKLEKLTGKKDSSLLSFQSRLWWMQIAEMRPDLAHHSKALLTALISNNKGNLSCRHHSLTTKGAAAEEGDTTYFGHDISGRSGPQRFKIKLTDGIEREAGFFNCGCEEIPAMLEVILWKEGVLHTTIVNEDGREDISEPWRAMVVHPRDRLYWCKLHLETLGLNFDDLFTHEDDRTPKPFHELEMLEKRIAALADKRDALQDQIAARAAARALVPVTSGSTVPPPTS